MLEVVNKIIEMSIQASFVICIILIVRYLFLKLNIPKQLIQVLWVIPLFRLVCPVTIAAGFSFMPTKLTGAANQMEQGLVDYVGAFPTGKPIGDRFSTESMAEYQQAVSTLVTEGTLTDSGKYDYIPNSIYMKEPIEGVTTGVITEMISPNWVFMLIWLIGLGALIAYSIVATIRLRKKLVGSVWVTNNYYRADHIETPFVLGVIRPKIYLPSSMPEDATDMILQHENMHIRRKDHIVKLIVYAITCVYWFNPLAWVMYILFCRDMESAVDEKVVSKYDEQERKTYATLLLALSSGHRHLISAPLAFGEGDVKDRVKNVVKYKKPITILVIVAVVVAIVLAAGLLTSRTDKRMLDMSTQSNRTYAVTVQYGTFFNGSEYEDITLTSYQERQLLSALQECNLRRQIGSKFDVPSVMDNHYLIQIIQSNDANEYAQMRIGADGGLYTEEKNYKMLEYETVYELLENFRTTDMGEETVAAYGEPMDYWQNEDGTWNTENHTYQYCLKLFGAGNSADIGTLYTVLSNDPNITFQETWLASGFSSNMADYFTADYAVIASWETYGLPGIYELPLYEYSGEDALLGAICNYQVAVDLISDTSHGTLRIPAPVLLKIDDSDKTDIKVWGNFYSYSYIQDGTKLITESGGEQPGIMHLAQTENGYVVIGFEGVRDGSYFADDMRALCQGYPGLYLKMMSISDNKRDEVRKELIEAYVSSNNLNITAYQDYGWEPVELDVEVDASAVTDAQISAQILTDKYVDLAKLPILDLDVRGEHVFEDRTFIVNNRLDNMLEEMVYEYHLYRMMPDYEKAKALIAEETYLYGMVQNEEAQYLEGKYHSEEKLGLVDTFSKEDLSKISNYSVNSIQSLLVQYQLHEYAIVEVNYTVKYNGALEEAGPQYGPGRRQVYYLLGRISTRDEWKIYETYREEYFILE